MIDDMLFLAKADNGLIIPEQVDIDLVGLVSRLIEYYQLAAEDRSIRLALQGEGTIRGDRLMIDRAVSTFYPTLCAIPPKATISPSGLSRRLIK